MDFTLWRSRLMEASVQNTIFWVVSQHRPALSTWCCPGNHHESIQFHILSPACQVSRTTHGSVDITPYTDWLVHWTDRGVKLCLSPDLSDPELQFVVEVDTIDEGFGAVLSLQTAHVIFHHVLYLRGLLLLLLLQSVVTISLSSGFHPSQTVRPNIRTRTWKHPSSSSFSRTPCPGPRIFSGWSMFTTTLLVEYSWI